MSYEESSRMFKKPDGDYTNPEPAPPAPRITRAEPRREAATIGPSISIKGDLTGEEDLVVQGRVDGKVDLKQYSVTIGREGKAKADIYGRLICIEGEVEGNLYGQEQVTVRSSGSVRGNISSPRVAIEDGAKFKGSIDMEVPAGSTRTATSPAEVKSPVSKPALGGPIPAGGAGSRPDVTPR